MSLDEQLANDEEFYATLYRKWADQRDRIADLRAWAKSRILFCEQPLTEMEADIVTITARKQERITLTAVLGLLDI